MVMATSIADLASSEVRADSPVTAGAGPVELSVDDLDKYVSRPLLLYS